MKFDFDKWAEKIHTTTSMYGHLRSYIENEKSMKLFMDSNFGDIDAFEKSLNIPERLIRRTFDGLLYGEIQNAFKSYSRQMIVIASTYIEGMLQEFFTVTFRAKPDTMHEFISRDETRVGQGYIQLQEILRHSNLEDLLETLVLRASKNASDGPIIKVAKRIKRLTKYEIHPDIVQKTQRILDLRNSIVHDNDEKEIGRNEVDDAFHVTFEFLRGLGSACIEAKLPFKYSWAKNPDTEEN